MFILSFNIVISRCKFTISGLFNISHTFLYFSNIMKQTHCLCGSLCGVATTIKSLVAIVLHSALSLDNLKHLANIIHQKSLCGPGVELM